MPSRIVVPREAVAAYEALRKAVIAGMAGLEDAATLRYHGMLLGLPLLIGADPPPGPCVPHRDPGPPLPRDGEIIRLLANLVLHAHSEAAHVY